MSLSSVSFPDPVFHCRNSDDSDQSNLEINIAQGARTFEIPIIFCLVGCLETYSYLWNADFIGRKTIGSASRKPLGVLLCSE